MSEIIEFEVSEYSRASQNIFLQPFIFESVTSDSTIPVSITGTTDQDNALLAVQYYADGVPAGAEILKDTNFFQRINTYSSAISFNDTGVKVFLQLVGILWAIIYHPRLSQFRLLRALQILASPLQMVLKVFHFQIMISSLR